jgi:hypothetical protein
LIIFLTTRGHGYTLTEMAASGYAPGMPRLRLMDYETALWARSLPRATYIFTDIERLYPWEQRGAADLYRNLTAAGLRCLNDPARAMSRFELLRALYRAGLNPFNAYRADDDPAPARFPVFIRLEGSHEFPVSGLLADATVLAAELTRLAAAGWPRRLLLVVEYCAEPIAENIWCKHGTFRVGNQLHLDRNVLQDNWIAKMGTAGIWTADMYEDESRAIAERRYADALRPVFDLAGIEWGRADHGTVAGREVIYEINTNPHVTKGNKQISAFRDAALAISANYMRDDLQLIDCGQTGTIKIERSPHLGGRARRLVFAVNRP